jgi:hypothetical protein
MKPDAHGVQDAEHLLLCCAEPQVFYRVVSHVREGRKL